LSFSSAEFSQDRETPVGVPLATQEEIHGGLYRLVNESNYVFAAGLFSALPGLLPSSRGGNPVC
jgi:hypothetical protein